MKIPGPPLKPLPKRPYDMTVEENKVEVAAQVKAHFAPKKPEAKVQLDPKVIEHFREMVTQPAQYKMNLRSDYEREIIKQDAKRRKNKNQVQKAVNKFPSSVNRKINRSPRS